MQNCSVSEIATFVHEHFAQEVGLDRSELASGVTLADVVRNSPRITNSVDLMECFAKTSNAVRKRYGVRVRLPTYPVNTTIQKLVDSFIEQVQAQITQQDSV
jgi:hypothetical protein